jgi:hypothetical protein
MSGKDEKERVTSPDNKSDAARLASNLKITIEQNANNPQSLQNDLNKIIEKLSNDDKIIDNHNENEYISQLFKIYSNKAFRHSYSQLTRIIIKYNEQGNGELLHTLTVNMQRLNEIIEEKYSTATDEAEVYFLKSFRKLYDHFNLESSRLGFIDKIKRNYEITLEQYESRMKSQEDTINDLNGIIRKYDDRIDRKLDNANVQSITVLSIFAAIVITFTGGFSLLGNALSSTAQINAFRLVTVIALIGLVLYDIIIALMFIVSRINNKHISVICKKNVEDNGCLKCVYRNKKIFHPVICQAINKYPYIVFANVLLLGIIAITFSLWSISCLISAKFWIYDIILAVTVILAIIIYYKRHTKHTR